MFIVRPNVDNYKYVVLALFVLPARARAKFIPQSRVVGPGRFDRF